MACTLDEENVTMASLDPVESDPLTIYCPQCGRAMRIASRHVHATVACPHCDAPVNPGRTAGASPASPEAQRTPPPFPPEREPSSDCYVPPTERYEQPHAPFPEDGRATQEQAAPRNRAPYVPEGYSFRSRVVAALLGIFLGPLGAHRFYLGYMGTGIIQIIVTFATGGIGGLWGFVEGILCLSGQMRDVDGLPLRD